MLGDRKKYDNFGVWGNAFKVNLEKLNSMCVVKMVKGWGLRRNELNGLWR